MNTDKTIKALKVLVVLSNLRVSNGVASYIMNYFRKIDFHSIKMDFALYQDIETPYYDEIRKQGGKIFILPSVKSIRKHISCCNKILQQEHYDIIHDNTLLLSYFMMYCAKKNGIPIRILHSHNSRLGETKYKEIRNKWLLPLLLNTANAYFACSDLAAQALFGKRPYVFVPNVISVKKFSFNESIRERVRNQFHCGNKFIIGTVGRLAAQKNPFYAIDTIIKVYEHNSNIQYWWIGSGPLMDRVRTYIKEKGATSYIRLFGSRNDIADLYQAMDLFFLPSLFEGLPVTGVEAQAMGLPCLLSDTITKEVVYTDLVTFFSINTPAEIVSTHFMNIRHELSGEQRKKYYRLSLNSIFSDTKAGEYLLKKYYEYLYQLKIN